MTEIDLFDYFPSKNNEYNKLLWVIAHDMHNFRILAKNERFSNAARSEICLPT